MEASTVLFSVKERPVLLRLVNGMSGLQCHLTVGLPSNHWKPVVDGKVRTYSLRGVIDDIPGTTVLFLACTQNYMV